MTCACCQGACRSGTWVGIGMRRGLCKLPCPVLLKQLPHMLQLACLVLSYSNSWSINVKTYRAYDLDLSGVSMSLPLSPDVATMCRSWRGSMRACSSSSRGPFRWRTLPGQHSRDLLP